MAHENPVQAAHERERVSLLQGTRLLDTGPEEAFDRITRLASQIFRVPIALVSFVDSHRQWFKSAHGLDARETERSSSFCSHAIEQDGVMVVEDAATDPRFADNPLVLGAPFIRFYAGAPLVLPSGHALGSLCIIDSQPRRLGDEEKAWLSTLASLVMAQIDLHQRAGRINEVTRLPNRAQLAEDIETRRRSDPGGSRAILLVDVMGHHRLQAAVRAIGIEPMEGALRRIAMRLREVLGAEWPIYHVSETRFCIKLGGESVRDREAFAAKVLDALSQSFDFRGIPVSLEIHAGLVAFELDRWSGPDALRKASTALHEAAAQGKRCFWYSEEMDRAHLRAFGLARDVIPGLARGEFRLVYQPKFNIKAATFTGVEALIRWRHPAHGDVSPGEFIPLVEQTSAVHRLTDWVLDHALRQLSEWKALGIDMTVAVNVSARNLEALSFPENLLRKCRAHGIAPQALHVECTENSVMTRSETREALLRIKALGMQISLDDFGMGYSNLACLRDLPVEMLKLDQSLVKPIDTDARALDLVTSLIVLGQGLGYRMLAEGVETAQVLDRLVNAGCDAAQGYYLSRPLEPGAIPAFFASRSLGPVAGLRP